MDAYVQTPTTDCEMSDQYTDSVQKAPKWNFWKFLVGPDGQVVRFWKAEEPFEQIRQEVTAQVRQIILKKRHEL